MSQATIKIITRDLQVFLKLILHISFLKKSVFNDLTLNKSIPLDSYPFSMLIKCEFDTLNYAELIDLADHILPFGYEEVEKKWIERVKDIFYSHESLKFYKYHCDLFFSSIHGSFEILRYTSEESLIHRIKNNKKRSLNFINAVEVINDEYRERDLNQIKYLKNVLLKVDPLELIQLKNGLITFVSDHFLSDVSVIYHVMNHMYLIKNSKFKGCNYNKSPSMIKKILKNASPEIMTDWLNKNNHENLINIFASKSKDLIILSIKIFYRNDINKKLSEIINKLKYKVKEKIVKSFLIYTRLI